jgi:hypothetical protein
MTEAAVSVASMEESIQAWPQVFSDLADGDDIKTWAKATFKSYAPALVVGQEANSVRIGAPLKPDEQVTFSFPAYFDDNPASGSQAGEKVKFAGKRRDGVVALTEAKVVFAHESSGRLCVVCAIPLERVKAFNLLTFKFSLISMTSAGPGFELIYTEPDGSVERAVFRIALTPKRADAFENQVRGALDLSGPQR